MEWLSEEERKAGEGEAAEVRERKRRVSSGAGRRCIVDLVVGRCCGWCGRCLVWSWGVARTVEKRRCW